MQVVDEWSAQSFRVLAIAAAEVPHISRLSLGSMSQQHVEDHAGNLAFVGLIILSNHVNADSKATVQQLQDRSGLCTHGSAPHHTLLYTQRLTHVMLGIAAESEAYTSAQLPRHVLVLLLWSTVRHARAG